MSEEPSAIASPEVPTKGAPEGAEGGEDSHERAVWTSRVAFYFAAIGAAVGFGNVWRFPSLSVEYGGGAFFIPYLMALFILGIPLAILEIGFGQYFQTGDIGVFGGFHPRLRGVGLSSVACGFMLDTYYSVLIAWVLNAFFDSFASDSIWRDPDVTADIAIDHFIDEIIGAGTLVDGTPTRIVGRNVGFSALVWILIYFCVAFGVKWTGRLTYFTMGLPIVLLFVFLGKAVSLEGSELGIKEYIGIWDLSVLKERGEVWSVACSQIFFSIGVTFGILTAYGSHCKRDEPVVLNSCVVALSNSMFSFIAGFAVFASLGHLAYKQGVAVTELDYGGFSLVFGTWPVVFNTLPGGIHWVRLLFFDLFLLGIDSAFAFQEAFITVLKDTVFFQHVPRWQLALLLCVVGFLFSLIYCTDAGLNFLDVIDFYINFVMIIVGFFEAFGSAWAYNMVDQMEMLGKGAVLSFHIANFGAVFLACGLWFGLNDNQVWGGFVGGLGFYFVGVAISGYFLSQPLANDTENKWTMGALWYELYMGNIVHLKNKIEPVIGYVPYIWCVLMKHIIPHLLIILFINLAQSDNGSGEPIFGGYGGYSTRPYQILGILTFCFAAFIFVAGVGFPALYEPLARPQNEDAASAFNKYSTKASPVATKGEVPPAKEGSEEENEELEKGDADANVDADALKGVPSEEADA